MLFLKFSAIKTAVLYEIILKKHKNTKQKKKKRCSEDTGALTSAPTSASPSFMPTGPPLLHPHPSCLLVPPLLHPHPSCLLVPPLLHPQPTDLQAVTHIKF